MADLPTPLSDEDILAARPAGNRVDPQRPYAFHVEPERTAAGRVEPVATIFLSNRECPFRCLMCDLWRNTTEEPVPPGAIPDQIDYALSRLPPARHIKLYNSGNFFDPQAIPPDDYRAVAARIRHYDTVIVENHPRLCGKRCSRFRDELGTRLEIAIGLETVHPDVLPRLNKQMTLGDFDRAVEFLLAQEVSVRTFILLKPPYLDEEQGVEWAVRSIDYAFSRRVGCCTVIPTRAGNGIMEQLQQRGLFSPPTLRSLERAVEAGIRLGQGRVFADLWDIERFFNCPRCGPQRARRLDRMNLSQQVEPPVACDCGAGR